MATTPLPRLVFAQVTTACLTLQPTLASQLRNPFVVDVVLQPQPIASNQIVRAMGSAQLAQTK